MKKLFRFLLWSFLIIDLIVLNLAVAALVFLDATWSVERSTVIPAEPDEIFPQVAVLKNWETWTPWDTDTYPSLRYEYHGTPGEVGSYSTWTSDEMGGGKLLITEVEPNRRIAYECWFEGFENPLLGEVKLDPEKEGTRVVWSGRGDYGSNPFWRWMGVAFFRSAIGDDYEEGLGRLKSAVVSRENATETGTGAAGTTVGDTAEVPVAKPPETPSDNDEPSPDATTPAAPSSNDPPPPAEPQTP